MAINSSSSSISSSYHCLDTTGGVVNTMAFSIANICLLLPLSLLILYLGHQRRRQQQRSFTTTSHSDIFTYHSSAVVLIYAVGFALYCCGEYFGHSNLTRVGLYAMSVFLAGQMFFHILTCLERYLAVVHPITYLAMRQSRGVRIRSISIGCVWLLCCGWIGVTALCSPDLPYVPFFCLLGFSITVVSFCSLSVLCVLICPRTREMGGNQGRVRQSKQRAFYTIVAITGVLWLYFLGFLLCLALDRSHVVSYNDSCLVLTSGKWFTLPSSLVLPLLFLHRAGKLFCCHCSNE